MSIIRPLLIMATLASGAGLPATLSANDNQKATFKERVASTNEWLDTMSARPSYTTLEQAVKDQQAFVDSCNPETHDCGLAKTALSTDKRALNSRGSRCDQWASSTNSLGSWTDKAKQWLKDFGFKFKAWEHTCKTKSPAIKR